MAAVTVAETPISGNIRISRYTPAVTMVAAWIWAETGVGPAMASGSQTERGSWADFPAAPISSRMPRVVMVAVGSREPMALSSLIEVVPESWYSQTMAMPKAV